MSFMLGGCENWASLTPCKHLYDVFNDFHHACNKLQNTKYAAILCVPNDGGLVEIIVSIAQPDLTVKISLADGNSLRCALRHHTLRYQQSEKYFQPPPTP